MRNQEFVPHDWKEWRRLRALELDRKGWIHSDIAEAMGVTEGTVSKWLDVGHRCGEPALLSHPSPGHPPKLAEAQKRLIPDFLWHGSEAYGFRGDVWTCARVAKVIERELGVHYHKDHVSRLLKELDWTPQTPVTRAVQRDEEEIDRWRLEVWPGLKKKARKERRTLVFVDESGFYLLPGVVKTYSPKGLTPILYEWATRDHLSLMSGVTPKGKLYTLVRPETLTSVHAVLFLEHLLRQQFGRWLVIWDGSPIHRSHEVKDYLASDRGKWFHLERLPPYAPDLNPDEGVWQHLKHVELRNLPCLDLEELHIQLYSAIEGRQLQSGWENVSLGVAEGVSIFTP